jgi:hypothetical protein
LHNSFDYKNIVISVKAGIHLLGAALNATAGDGSPPSQNVGLIFLQLALALYPPDEASPVPSQSPGRVENRPRERSHVRMQDAVEIILKTKSCRKMPDRFRTTSGVNPLRRLARP